MNLCKANIQCTWGEGSFFRKWP